jgi:two-component system phosphate regulon sensor histidine kinase PhoR
LHQLRIMRPFLLRSSALRLGIFIGTLIIAIILTFQLIWLKRVYQLEQKEFDHSVVKAIRGVYEDLNITSFNTSPLNQLIETPGRDIYIAHMSSAVDADSLLSYLQYELEDFEIFTTCHAGIYQAATNSYTRTAVLSSPVGKEKKQFELPVNKRPYDYIALSFPYREGYILSQMNFWIISSAALLILLILLAGSLYYFYRQKFLNETQKDFIHNFTHEFKTPVAVIGLAADVLKDKKIIDKPERLETYAGIVGYQANYLHSQIERLLRFAYTDSNHIHLQKEKVDLHQLIEESITNLAPLILEKKAAFEFHFDATDHTLNADRGYLLIVVTNLIDNAIKYSRSPKVIIRTVNNNQQLTLSVSDNGIGIEKQQLKKIFRKFYRAQSGEVYAAKGFGIGLAFVKKIVAAHKGKIMVESQPGSGSKFIIELPTQ